MKRKIYSLLILLFSSLTIMAQQKTVSGTVTKENGDPLPGVTVAVKGTKTVTLSNSQGYYKIVVPASNSTLVFTYVGDKKQEIVVNGRADIDIGMAEEVSTLNDVVVVGYSTQKRRDLTSSISSIGAKDLKDVPINSAAEALAGRLAGVQVIVSEGAPGADVDIFVRGRNSITQSGSPLYVVDGVQVENALSILSPQDIASIDVLKDAASTAIYGARGSNGVVLITTKGGKNTGGKTTVTYNAFAGVSQVTKELDVMDPYNFVLYAYERAKYTENATDTGVAAQYIRFTGGPNTTGNYDTIAKTYQNYPMQDWQKTIMGRNAFQMTHNLSVSGGTAATQYNLSVTLNKQEGLLLKSDYQRKLLGFRFDHKVSDKLKIGFNVRYNEQKITGAGTSDAGGAGSNRLRQFTRYRPLLLTGQQEDTYDPVLEANNPGNGIILINPVKLVEAEYRVRKITAYNFNGYINSLVSGKNNI